MHADDYVGWLALALTPGLGPRLSGKRLREFGSPDGIFNASLTALEAQRLPVAVAQAVHSRQPLSEAAKELAKAQALGCHLLTWDEPEYPARLLEIYDPPPLLYVRGKIDLLNKHGWRLWERVVRPLMGIKWLSGWGRIWLIGAW